MKLAAPKGVGAEPKKLALLGGIVVFGGLFVWWMNGGDNTPAGQQAAKSSGTIPVPAVVVAPRQTNGQRVVPGGSATASATAKRAAARVGTSRVDDFRPTLKLPEDFDISSVDPTLKVELLARVRNVGDGGSTRSLFEFYTPPPPPPKVEPIKPTPPPPPPPVKAEPPKVSSTPVTPPPPPIPLKFYGFAGNQRDVRRKGLFIDGDDIFMSAENDLIRNRYRIVRLGITSAEVEDTVAKNRQTLPLLEPCETVGPGTCPLTSNR